MCICITNMIWYVNYNLKIKTYILKRRKKCMYCSSLEVSTPIKRILKIWFKSRLYSTNCVFPLILRLAHVLLRGDTTLHHWLPQSNPPSLLACTPPLCFPCWCLQMNEPCGSKWGQTTPCLSLTPPHHHCPSSLISIGGLPLTSTWYKYQQWLLFNLEVSRKQSIVRQISFPHRVKCLLRVTFQRCSLRTN